jgi:hypothetical protein
MVLAAAMLTACSSEVRILEVVASGDGTRLGIGLDACGGTYAVTVGESTEQVMLTFTDQRSPVRIGGDDCSDFWSVDLATPLGDRALVDGARGEELEVRYEPWNQQRYTEAEYRAALEATATCIAAADPEARVAIVDGPAGPSLDVDLGDLPDGASRADPVLPCSSQHLDPLRR